LLRKNAFKVQASVIHQAGTSHRPLFGAEKMTPGPSLGPTPQSLIHCKRRYSMLTLAPDGEEGFGLDRPYYNGLISTRPGIPSRYAHGNGQGRRLPYAHVCAKSHHPSL